MRRLYQGLIVTVIMIFFPYFVHAYEYDLGLSVKDIFFDKEYLIKGQPIRIYAVVKNYGEKDVSAYVSFYSGPQLIGESQLVSVRAKGHPDEVFVDWIVPHDSFNILAKIQGQHPRDDNAQNDTALTKIFIPDVDTDGDGIPDKYDDDDDNDGLSDVYELEIGTDPLKWDTDGDGVNDKDDAYPLDPTRWKKEEQTHQNQIVKEEKEQVLPTIISNTSQTQTSTSIANSVSVSDRKTPSTPIEAQMNPQQQNMDDDTFFIAEDSLFEAEEGNTGNDVMIHVEKKSWNAYIFEAELPFTPSSQTQYIWNLPNGVTKQGNMIAHTFSVPGRYIISLHVLDDEDVWEQEMSIHIPFFQWHNHWLWMASSLSLAFCLASLFVFLRKRTYS